jgi:hypothetical protein
MNTPCARQTLTCAPFSQLMTAQAGEESRNALKGDKLIGYRMHKRFSTY